jgi:protein SCO1
MPRSSATSVLALGLLAVAWCAAMPAAAQVNPPGLENVGVDEHLDRQLPRDLVFRDHDGQRVTLGSLMDGQRPVLLHFVYHTCPTVCSVALDGVVSALAQQGWTAGEEFTVLTVSVDARDTPEVASESRRRALYRYGRESAQRGWHFLVAERSMTERELTGAYGVYPAVERLAEAVGFRYQWMPRQRQYAHPAVIMLLTPDARVARYLYGLEHAPNDLRIGLLEASEGRSISTVERVLLFCYRYDASEQAYVVMAWRVVRIGGGLTALGVLAFLGLMWRRELKRRRTPPNASSRSLDAEASLRS